jgi:hypothetical protein
MESDQDPTIVETETQKHKPVDGSWIMAAHKASIILNM